MRYAEVSVNSPIARRQTFSYTIPAHLKIEAGHAVWVPFGEKVLQGIVLALSPSPAVEETREIISLIEPQPMLSPPQIELARWLSDYYLTPLFDAVALLLPPGFERKVITFLRATDKTDIMSNLSEEQQRIMTLVRQNDSVSLKELEKKLGKKKAQHLVSQMVQRNLLARDYTPEPIKVSTKKETYLSLALSPTAVVATAAELRRQRAHRQATLLEFLTGQSGKVSLAAARKNTGVSAAAISAMVRRGFITLEDVEVARDPLSRLKVNLSFPLPLSPAQEEAFQQVKNALHQPEPKPGVFLLHGVTGSGKTEIYLQALAEAVRLGKRGIILVPEIALTPQTIERFAARFPQRVAVLHSRLSLGEQFDQWQRIKNGECDVVIGSRSAVFAPQPDLGLIVIDEEHEWTYKQHDTSPRYHARHVALQRARLCGAVIILGSATPDVETYYHAQRGNFRLLELPERVIPHASLPRVEIVDMREELKSGNRSIFSRALAREIDQTIRNREQVILFLNRRGAATFIQCHNCGFTLRCRRCDTPLTYHQVENMLVCHQCNYKTPAPASCPRCQQRQLKFLGLGTEKLEQEANSAFPGAKQLRWDSDTTRGKNAHAEIMGKFREREADILIGTQMVAKGLDLPSVTLVGVVSADTALNLPDFRAGERTFQVLSQVAGRAGRGGSPGKVIIQTYVPEHYAIQAAAQHDYLTFYRQEINYRHQLRNPPFRQLASLLYGHSNEAACRRETERMKSLIIAEAAARGIAGINIIGPAPAFLPRLRGRYRWQLVLRGAGLSPFLADIPFPHGWIIDIDPMSLI